MQEWHYRIQLAFVAYCGPQWSWDSNVHTFKRFNLWLVRQGRGTLVSGSETFSLTSGDCFVLRNWDHQTASHDPDDPLILPCVLFDIVDASGVPIPREHLDLPPVHLHMQDSTLINAIISRLRDHAVQDTLNSYEAHRWLDAALIEYRHQGTRVSGSASAQRARVERWRARINETECFDLSVEQMARESYMSVDHFIRLFARYMGVTPAEYKIRARLDKARAMLRMSNYSVTEIAKRLAYPDIHTFSRQFTKRMGMSPTAFRAGG
ncbi:MAG: helix-turn-helix domain-containing protein [Chitinivibrionales bacterium]|nr:helix-turn-helix domain-containing protein [Chitinivibrionales bacterium]